VHPNVAVLMLKEETDTIHQLEDEWNKTLTIIPVKDLHQEKYEIFWDSAE